ncbi:alpha-1,4-glucan--maltose-1-phosphate maltosyltransferase [Fulvivirga kasyanovii]|uniref:alpha-1,4-glucan--maltose-1-phosphate maltosyltransferase n=2 Tax=Fulvivirga kasyanovii TaxID=396812 RepID=UPI0031D00BC4
MKELEGQKRVTIENVTPLIDGGKYPIKRTVGERVVVNADIFVDGHDKVEAALLYRKVKKPAKGKSAKAGKWTEVPMTFMTNDHWRATFTPEEEGFYEYTIKGWIDYYGTWQDGLKKKFDAKQDIKTELLIGAELMEDGMARVSAPQRKKLEKWVKLFRNGTEDADAVEEALSDDATQAMFVAQEHSFTRTYHRILQVNVERKKALFSTWYEFFPRSASPVKGKHGTFKDCEQVLPEIAKMGFDVIYLPPIHPIGRKHRKGKNNAVTASEGDPGSPWAIGAEEGGHKSINPELGTMDDFTALVKKANELNIEIALDFAIQCSPDHPYVSKHPDWFKWRPDGTIQYAENPPKKYQDVLPVNFETHDWENLWKELKSIIDFWISKGVKIFRVDNPHTKPFTFWEWLIREVRSKHPETIFLAEAFTRPRIMEQLAKIGFTQSYTYFTWRNTSEEFREYLHELTRTEVREYFRPNFWPNTPDILPISLEHKPESAFIARYALAATLSSNCGIYGPLFEFGLNEPYPGKEEYVDSEKYEIKHWDWKKTTKIKEAISKINKVRKENAALQTTWHVAFCEVDNQQLLCYAKTDQEKQSKMIVAVNLDPEYVQSGWVKVPFEYLDLPVDESFVVHDLLTGNKYTWQNEWNYVELHPQALPVHIFKIEPNL